MNKPFFVLLLMLFTSHASIVYTVDIDRAGFASVVLSLESEEGTEFLLPADAKNFRIVGGSYSIINDTVSVTSGNGRFMTFSFSSDMLTEKTASGWKLFLSPPKNSTVNIYMPPYATIEPVSTQPSRVFSDESRTLLEMEYQEVITIHYQLEEQPILSKAESDFFAPYFLIGIVLLAFFAGKIFAIPMKSSGARKEKKPTLDMTPGKKEMMETFNENDLKIVTHLLESGGKSKRNILERKAGISRSSLSMALNRLEKRKIIEIDRTATTHFVKLSDYFLEL